MNDFAVPHYLTASYLDGVYLAVNAIPDAYLVYDAHDCGYFKAERIAGNHDLFSDLLRWDQAHRVRRTNLEMSDYVMGAQDKLGKTLLQVSERHDPGILFVVRSLPVVVSGQDATQTLRETPGGARAPRVLLPDRNLDKDFVTGYLDVVAGMSARLEARPGRGARDVVLTGYLFGRHEGDHAGDLQELGRMLRAIGARPRAVLLDGRPFRRIRRLPCPGLVVDLASDWAGGDDLARLFGLEALRAGLPLGIQGSVGWLRAVAAGLHLEGPAEAFLRRELAPLARTLEWLLPRFFAGRSVALFADRLQLGPLGRFLEELGLLIAGVGCTSLHPGAAARPLPGADPSWPRLPDPLPRLREHLAEACAAGRLDLVVGNSIVGQLVRDLPLAFVEIGYPSQLHHVLHPAPLLGFAGVRVMVERLLNALIAPRPQGRGGGGDACA